MTGHPAACLRFGLIALAAISGDTASFAQRADRTPPPAVSTSAGQFHAHRLTRPPVLDGRVWIAAVVTTASSPGTVPVPQPGFALTLTGCGDVGDFVRCQVFFQRGRTAPVRIDDGFTGWVFVTPDGRYVVMEPLHVLDVRAWTRYRLSEVLHIPNYTKIEAVSPDGQHLLVTRRDCAIDCGDVPVEFYDLALP